VRGKLLTAVAQFWRYDDRIDASWVGGVTYYEDAHFADAADAGICAITNVRPPRFLIIMFTPSTSPQRADDKKSAMTDTGGMPMMPYIASV
jgi:hypothetical protein